MSTRVNTSARTAKQRVIVFDVGGVIVQWKPLDLMRTHFPEHATDETSAKAVAATLFQSFVPGCDWAAFDAGTIEPNALADQLAARTGYARVNIAALIAAIPQHLVPMPDTVALIDRVRAAGHRLGLLSNMPRPYADHLEATHACFGHFEHLTWSGRVGHIKPQREIFDHVRDAMGIEDASQLVFIDDHPGNIEAARKLGWQAIHFTSAQACADELARV